MIDLKTVFMPSLRKINLAIILFVIFGYLLWPLITSLSEAGAVLFGFPMTIRTLTLNADPNLDFEPFNGVGVAVDVVFWYLVAAVAVWWWEKKGDE